eukprot:CAMPEP_0182453294 /NCGR_PEP_ID=MMETSP1319-20130603/416_1 /TAXON_ID=172717 /ORGANISM="Bolidomonas pacifica, Strain RCC208" /LENGTH=97 /DNA_ID=CAMNT_0024651209 /DNA_START=180 /DNA_END=473 /DNA_ORIENTATION=+
MTLPTQAIADGESSLFDVDIFDPKKPTTSAAPAKVDPLRSSKPSTPRKSSSSSQSVKEDPYSESAIRAKRAKANGLWGGGGDKKKKGQSLVEQMKGR